MVLQTDHSAGRGATSARRVQEAQDGSSDAHKQSQHLSDVSAEGLHGQTWELQRFLFNQVVQSEWNTVQSVI